MAGFAEVLPYCIASVPAGKGCGCSYCARAQPSHGTMQVLTRQGSALEIRLTATRQVRGGHPEPIVEFRFSGGILCSSYYLSTFQEIEAGAGLCLQGGSFPQELEPDTVQTCQAWLREAQP